MSVRIIAEVGSTHMGKWVYCKEALDRCNELGVDAVKFQLFPNTDKFTSLGNIWMPKDLYLQSKEYGDEIGIQVSASVFGPEELTFLLSTNPEFVKFAYSMKQSYFDIQTAQTFGTEAIVSCDVMSDADIPANCTKLFCIPQYPVYSQVSFEGIFPRFQGFSDHTLGFNQTLEAILAGATTIEKHITLNHSDIQCPDSRFALPIADFATFIARVAQMERQ